jgi:hypothetical protein
MLAVRHSNKDEGMNRLEITWSASMHQTVNDKFYLKKAASLILKKA